MRENIYLATLYNYLKFKYKNIVLELVFMLNMLQVMTRYISNPDNLKLMMNMLKEKSRNIQFEAFHVFKV